MFSRSASYFLIRFYPKQEMAWLAYKAGLNLVLPWGRRSGKSRLCAEILIEDVEDYGKPCLYVAKTQRQARKIIWLVFRSLLSDQKDWELKESTLEAVHKPSGAAIVLAGADLRPDDLVGTGYRVIVCDENALWAKPEIVQRVLVPMLADFDGQIIFVSTKRGKNHFYRLHERAMLLKNQYFCIEADIFDNTFISPNGRQKIIEEYEGGEQNPLYQQEIKNKYVTFEGMVFALPQESYIDKRWDESDLHNSFHWRGVDHGFSPDPTAALWIAYNERKKYFQIYSEYRQSKLLIHQHAESISTLEPFKFIDTYGDVDPQIISEYNAIGFPMSPAMKADKQARMLRLVTALKTGRLKIARNCTMLLDEMQTYEWEQDGNDHLIDAMNYGFNNLVLPEVIPVRKTVAKRFSSGENFEQSFGDD